MPRIDDQILDCVVYLYPSEADAAAGQRAGGSGFVVAVPSGGHEQAWALYVVTNSHVVREGQSRVIRLNTKRGDFEVAATLDEHWYHHPDGDDVAVCPIGVADDRFKFKFIEISMFLTQEIVAEHNIGAGDDAFLVGRFVNHEGRQRNLPTVRFGNIAMMPLEPMPHPRGISQESFLVEMRSIGGYSGSPVFVWIPPLVERPETRELRARRFGPWLMGVDWGHTGGYEAVLEKDGETAVQEGWKVRSNSGMTAVVPAWRLADLLNSDKLVLQRKGLDDKESQRAAAGS